LPAARAPAKTPARRIDTVPLLRDAAPLACAERHSSTTMGQSMIEPLIPRMRHFPRPGRAARMGHGRHGARWRTSAAISTRASSIFTAA
jgi:hypothetical protein